MSEVVGNLVKNLLYSGVSMVPSEKLIGGYWQLNVSNAHPAPYLSTMFALSGFRKIRTFLARFVSSNLPRLQITGIHVFKIVRLTKFCQSIFMSSMHYVYNLSIWEMKLFHTVDKKKFADQLFRSSPNLDFGSGSSLTSAIRYGSGSRWTWFASLMPIPQTIANDFVLLSGAVGRGY
jgi:hypothetical protein